jgi:hypothetical protein
LCARHSISAVRKLFQDDAAVKNGVLQVFVRMKPVPDTIDTCMVLDPNHLLKATWCAPELLQHLQPAAAHQQFLCNGSIAVPEHQPRAVSCRRLLHMSKLLYKGSGAA